MKVLMLFTTLSLLVTRGGMLENHAINVNVNEISSFETDAMNHNYVLKRQNMIETTFDVVFDCNGGIYDSLVSFQLTVIADSLLNEPDATKLLEKTVHLMAGIH